MEAPAPKARITAILNCFAPDGANRAQVVVREDGSLEIVGEASLAKAALRQVRDFDLRKLRGG